MSRPTLVLFPGLGVDGQLFEPQQPLSAVADIVIPPWLKTIKNESLERYAARMAQQVPPADKLWLGGMSFGGMIALEAAKILQPRGVILIASAFRGDAHTSLVQMVAGSISTLPEPMIKSMLCFAPLLVRMVGRPDRRQRELLMRLVDHANLDLTRWGGRATMDYRFTGKLPCPVYHIHGDIDRLVPIANIRANKTVPGAGHVVNVTHAAIVNQFIEQVIVGNDEALPRI